MSPTRSSPPRPTSPQSRPLETLRRAAAQVATAIDDGELSQADGDLTLFAAALLLAAYHHTGDAPSRAAAYLDRASDLVTQRQRAAQTEPTTARRDRRRSRSTANADNHPTWADLCASRLPRSRRS